MHYSEMAVMTMRESGQPWLGIIPSEWTLSKIGNLYSLRNEKVSDKDYPPLSVTMGGIVPQLETVAKSDNEDNRKLVRVGDFAINSRSDRRGSCGISEYDGSVSLINTVLMPRGEMNPSYYNWLFHTVSFADEFYKWGHGIVDDLWTTRWQEMKRIVVPVPPLDEQATIAAYLDDQVSQIDSIIEDEKASIEEYKRWKASVINEAVTKGLDKSLPKKNSHIPWIGSIPSTWKLIKVKRVVRIENGSDPQTEGDIPVYGSGTGSFKTCGEFKEGPTVLLGRKGATLHIPHYIEGKYWNVDTAFNVVVINGAINLKYFYYTAICFDYPAYRSQTTLPSMTQSNYYNMLIPYPSIDEQERIVCYLDKVISEIDELINEKKILIDDLEMYKRSLIYEVVTGKRKVV